MRNLNLLSVVVPCFNEEEVLGETYRQLSETLQAVEPAAYELIFVNDGSSDRTLEILQTLQRSDDRVKYISLSRNFGHQIAITAGMAHTQGDAVAVIDADLQDPVSVILEMVDSWRQGVDVAYGVRTEREGETAFKRWTASAFYRFINKLSDTKIPLDTGDFRLIDRKVADAMNEMGEQYRFVRGMVAWTGFRQEPVYYARARRFAGETKYPLSRMLRLAADSIVSFSTVPLRLASYLGLATSFLAVIGIVYALFVRLLTEDWVPGWTFLFIAILFVGGVQLIFLGIIGEYLGRIYGEVKRRPLYLIQDKAGFDDAGNKNE